MNDTKAIARWREEANELKLVKELTQPLRILLGESVEVAKFSKKYYEPTDKRPGLSSAGAKLPITVADEILSLREGVQDAQTAYLLIVEPKSNTPEMMDRGNFLVDEITATLEWYLDDGIEDQTDLQLEAVKTAHQDDTNSADSLAQSLHDYATLANGHKNELNGLGEFDINYIQEAFGLAEKLGGVIQGGIPKSEKAKNAIDLRNRMANLLIQRIRLVRSAARFVFRNHKEIIKEVTSPYERRRRAEHKRTKQAAVNA